MHSDKTSDLTVRVEEREGGRILYLEGALCLPNAGRLSDLLKEQIAPERQLSLDLARVTSVDLCGLQLICSAHRTFRRAGARLELQAASDALRQMASCAGYEVHQSVCPFRDDTCLWRIKEPSWKKLS